MEEYEAQLEELRALVGELSVQLQEAVQARTKLGVNHRLLEARVLRLQEENAKLRKPKKRGRPRKEG